MKTVAIILLLSIWSLAIQAQTITTIAGDGTMSSTGDGGLAATATTGLPFACVHDNNGNYYFTESLSCKVRKISSAGIITTVAGTGSCGYNGDGIPATDAQLNDPGGIAVDTLGNIFIGDGYNNRVRKVDVNTGTISTITGNGSPTHTGDGGNAAFATVWNPWDVCFDRWGNIYIADLGNNVVRKISATTGIISNYAGNGSTVFSGEGGQATNAGISRVLGLCTDEAGNLYMAGRFVSRVMKVSTSGILTTIAGTGLGNATGDGGPATASQINPQKLAFDKAGNLYVSSYYKPAVRKINTAGIITTVVGDTVAGFTGDGGPAIAARLNRACGISFDTCGNLYICDQSNKRIRKVDFNPTCEPITKADATITNTLATSIYPNPATTHITLTSTEPISHITIINTLGQQLVQTTSNKTQTTIPINHLPPGSYIINVNNRYAGRFVKQ